MVRNQKDFAAGILFVLIGGGFAIGSFAYQLGTVARVGPAFLPLCLGSFISVLGLVLCARALRRDADRVYLRGLNVRVTLCVLGGIVLFGVTLYPLGLIGATLVLVLAVSIASGEFRLPVALATTACLGVGAATLFIGLLGLPLPLWPAFVG